MKLDVGSGDLPLGEGWTTVDLYAPADVKADMANLPFDDGTVDAINCSHTLEHVGGEEVAGVLAEFRRVLKAGGTVEVEVPDLPGACRMYLEAVGADREDAYRAIYGEGARGRRHQGGFTVGQLAAALTAAGFEVAETRIVRSHGVDCIRAEAFVP